MEQIRHNFQKERIQKKEAISEEELIKDLILDIKNRFEEIFQRYTLEDVRDILESDLIIGEDASGRLPALFLHKLSKLFKEQGENKNNQRNPFLLFFAGFGNVYLVGNKSEKIKRNRKEKIKTTLINFITRHFMSKDISITIITDSILFGNSIEPLIDSIVGALKGLKDKQLINDIKINLITLRYLDWARYSNFIEGVKNKLGISLKIYFVSSKSAPQIYGKHSIIGVKKGDYSNIYSNLFSKRNRRLMNIAREKISLLGEEFFETIKSKL